MLIKPMHGCMATRRRCAMLHTRVVRISAGKLQRVGVTLQACVIISCPGFALRWSAEQWPRLCPPGPRRLQQSPGSDKVWEQVSAAQLRPCSALGDHSSVKRHSSGGCSAKFLPLPGAEEHPGKLLQRRMKLSLAALPSQGPGTRQKDLGKKTSER